MVMILSEFVRNKSTVGLSISAQKSCLPIKPTPEWCMILMVHEVLSANEQCFLNCFLSLSSEDELDILLNGTPDQKRKLIREYLTGESESSSGDEFEKEMEAELSSTIKSMECNWTTPSSQGSHYNKCLRFEVMILVHLLCNITVHFLIVGETSQTSGNTQNTGRKQQPQQYDDIYFDTDSDEDSQAGKNALKRMLHVAAYIRALIFIFVDCFHVQVSPRASDESSEEY